MCRSGTNLSEGLWFGKKKDQGLLLWLNNNQLCVYVCVCPIFVPVLKATAECKGPLAFWVEEIARRDSASVYVCVCVEIWQVPDLTGPIQNVIIIKTSVNVVELTIFIT